MEYSKLCIERQLLHKTHPFLLKRGKQYSSQCFRNRHSSKQHKQEFHTRALYTKTHINTLFFFPNICSETVILFKIKNQEYLNNKFICVYIVTNTIFLVSKEMGVTYVAIDIRYKV